MKRIQRRRTKGYRMPKSAMYVGRPTKWGNPFKDVGDMVYVYAGHRRKVLNPWVYFCMQTEKINAAFLFRKMLMNYNSLDVEPAIKIKFKYMVDTLKDLDGKDLACFCKLSQECHADALIELSKPIQL